MEKADLQLKNPIKIWFQSQPTKQNFKDSLVDIATVNNVSNFWGVYQHCNRPSSLGHDTYFYLFKADIKPVWEDPQNQQGGAFVLRFLKDKSDKVWEDIVLAFVALNINGNNLINGIRSKIRKEVQSIEIWIPNIDDEEHVEKAREWVIKATFLNYDTQIEIIKFKNE